MRAKVSQSSNLWPKVSHRPETTPATQLQAARTHCRCIDDRHRNKLVDLSLVFRLSGIPNMAKLELVKDVKPSSKKSAASGGATPHSSFPDALTILTGQVAK